MPDRRRRLAAATTVALLLAAGPAAAHKLRLFASVVGDTAEGRAYFVGSGPAVGVAVTLTDAEGVERGTTTTTADGSFRIALPEQAGMTLTTDARDGHFARFALDGPGAAATQSPAPAASGPTAPLDTAVIERAVARQVAPLAAQVDALDQSLRIRDVVGAVGYAFGLFGLWALWLRRRKAP